MDPEEDDQEPFSLEQLVDLALCSPEIGTVNFNILRLLLHDIIEKLGIEAMPVTLGDVETNHVHHYKSYIQGNTQATPLPGVLRVSAPGYAYGVKSIANPNDVREVIARSESMRTPKTPKTGREPPNKGTDPRAQGPSEGAAPPGKAPGGAPQPGKAPGGAAPGLTAQPGTTSGGTAPGTTTPGTTATGTTAPGTTAPGGAAQGAPAGTALGNIPQQNTGKGAQPGPTPVAPTSTAGATLPQTVTSPRLMDATKALEDKVGRLERHLDALYQLPTNQQLLDGNGQGNKEGKASGAMTVNDMWQIIQLNNRVASCESAIQKMATLIEDLATDLSKMRGDNKSYQNNAENLMEAHSRLSTDLSPLPEQCQLVQDALDELKKDLGNIRNEWKNELDKITHAIGVDPNKIPSFMKQANKSHSKTHHAKSKHHKDKKGNHSAPNSGDESPDHRGNLSDSDDEHTPRSDRKNKSQDKNKSDRNSKSKGPNRSDGSKSDGSSKPDSSGKSGGSSKPDRKSKSGDDKKREGSKSQEKKKNPNNMGPKEIEKLTVEEIEELEPEEAAAIKPSKLVHMTTEQLKKIDEVKNRKPKLDISKMSKEEIAKLSPSKLALLTPAQVAELTDSVLDLMTPEQRKEIEEIKSKFKGERGVGKTPPKQKLSTSEIERLTSSEIDNLTVEQIDNMTPEQKQLIAKNNAPKTDEGKPKSKSVSVPKSKDGRKSTVDGTDDASKKHKNVPSRHRMKGGPGGHVPVDILKGTIAKNENLPPIDQSEAKVLVQAEMQKQYGQLQAMQRQMANDIHEKMEFIYDKLLKDIVSQSEGTLPYMAVGPPVDALGPGVCTGAGMPAGIAVCQFPDATGRHAAAPGDKKVCPGPGLCPASDDCPNCSPLAQGQAGRGAPFLVQGHGAGVPGMTAPGMGPQARAMGSQGMGHPGMGAPDAGGLAAIGQHRAPYAQGQPRTSEGYSPLAYTQGPPQTPPPPANGAEDQLLLREMRSLILLDLEKIRNDMKDRDINTFDEQDMVERLDTIWEAIKIIKNNEETLAVKILRQDAILKTLPRETIDRIQKIPAENLEAIASAKWDKPMMLPSGTAVAGRSAGPSGGRPGGSRKLSQGPKNGGDSAAMDKEEVQKIYNNLSNLIAETTDHKNKLDRMGDQLRTMEVGMVTKQMLVDALGDKADKGQINTKVSYDEFGTAVEELHTNLRDLVVENFNKNEHWHRVTNDLADGVYNKLDKNELAPVKAFFKNHLKNLADKVNNLQRKFDEPDPAGTRKKLLRDFNCISCDRHCNISGVTNAPTLPTIGPINAAHTTASRRAFDLHRMRNKNKLLEDCRDLTLMEKQLKCLGLLNPDGSAVRPSDLDLVNRFQGGSHTNVTTASRIRSLRGGSSSRPAVSQASLYEEEEEDEEAMSDDIVIGSSELLSGFRPSEEEMEQVEEAESLLSYVPAYLDE